MQKIVITQSADAGQRLDRFLKKYLPNTSLGGIYKMLRTGKIKVGGKKKDPTYKLEIDDELTFWLTDDELEKMKSETNHQKGSVNPNQINNFKKKNPPIEVLYEDEYLMVINKPAGINVHPGDHKTIEPSIIELVQDHLGGRYDSLTFRPALVHRIDRDTSGCLLIAKEKSTLESLLSTLQSHQIEKVYHTVVAGIPSKKQDTIRAKLLRIENATNEAKVRVDPKGQSAVTHYNVLQTYSSNTSHALLECRIETGRTHQIRVHLASIGHPTIGDKAYGDKKYNSHARTHFGIQRQLLHAQKLIFKHPKTGKVLTIEAPYPEDFQKMIEAI